MAAVKELSIPATILEVTRRPQSVVDVRPCLDSIQQLTPIAALGMFGDAQAGSRVLSTLNRWGRSFADTFQTLNKGSHERYAGDLGKLIVDTRKFVGMIEEKLP